MTVRSFCRVCTSVCGILVDRLTDDGEIDLVTGMARYSGVPVSLHPAG
ncbi:MAG TPA: hypothetical protein VFB77_16020 [Acidimicrobiales bacterium]|nr:hypothetical protein [Acidimicrobiales bacterium]